MKTKILKSTFFIIAAVLILAACGGAAQDSATAEEPAPDTTQAAAEQAAATGEAEEEAQQETAADELPLIVQIANQNNLSITSPNDNPIIDGLELTWAIGSTTPFPGIWEGVFWLSAIDNDIRLLTHTNLFNSGWDLNISNLGGPATVEFDRENQTAHITLNERVYWHDGVLMTLDDLVFAYEVIAHPDYTGPRWGNTIWNVVGANEYREGLVDYIEGLVLSEDQMELTIHFVEFSPAILSFGFWSTPIPRHNWEGIAVADMEAHPRARHETLGNGPFIITDVVPGESVRLVRNENYWRGVPNLGSIVVEVVAPLTLPLAMQQGLYDIASPFPQSGFEEQFRNPTNFNFLSNPLASNAGNFVGFRMGSWDSELGQSVSWDEPRHSIHVRRAISLLMDHLGSGTYFFNGLVIPSDSIYFGMRRIEWVDTSIPRFNHFDPALAAQILDDAGYIDADGDGFRDRPDGSPMEIIFLAAAGTPANENTIALHLQNWHDAGLNVQLFENRLVDGTQHLDIRQNDSDGGVVDFYTFGWGFGANPNPVNIFGRHTTNNWGRYTNEHWDYIFSRFESDQMWDEDFTLETVQLWQEAAYESGVFFPTTATIGLTAINNRVANFSLEITGNPNYVSSWNPWLWGLTAEQRYQE